MEQGPKREFPQEGKKNILSNLSQQAIDNLQRGDVELFATELTSKLRTPLTNEMLDSLGIEPADYSTKINLLRNKREGGERLSFEEYKELFDFEETVR